MIGSIRDFEVGRKAVRAQRDNAYLSNSINSGASTSMKLDDTQAALHKTFLQYSKVQYGLRQMRLDSNRESIKRTIYMLSKHISSSIYDKSGLSKFFRDSLHYCLGYQNLYEVGNKTKNMVIESAFKVIFSISLEFLPVEERSEKDIENFWLREPVSFEADQNPISFYLLEAIYAALKKEGCNRNFTPPSPTVLVMKCMERNCQRISDLQNFDSAVRNFRELFASEAHKIREGCVTYNLVQFLKNHYTPITSSLTYGMKSMNGMRLMESFRAIFLHTMPKNCGQNAMMWKKGWYDCCYRITEVVIRSIHVYYVGFAEYRQNDLSQLLNACIINEAIRDHVMNFVFKNMIVSLGYEGPNIIEHSKILNTCVKEVFETVLESTIKEEEIRRGVSCMVIT